MPKWDRENARRFYRQLKKILSETLKEFEANQIAEKIMNITYPATEYKSKTILLCDSHICPVRFKCNRNPESNSILISNSRDIKKEWLSNPSYNGSGCENYADLMENI